MEAEIWKDIPNHTGYMVSSLGRVKSIDRLVFYRNGTKRVHKGKILHLNDHEFGYKVVTLCHGNQTNFAVHDLVLIAFRGPRPQNKPHSRHLNGIPDDNVLSNLRYGTVKENIDDQVRHGTARVPLGQENGNAKLLDNNVIEIRKQLSEGVRGKDLAAKYGVSQATISEIKHLKMWRHLL